ncbi:MAG: filamentous hemagglutinin N-terminal domain-containing protein [Gammaproteobacteria bacterium]|jgi:filamentous hemagglutinin family protein
MDSTNHFTRTRLAQIISGALAICSTPTVLAEVTFDGSMGEPGTLQGANMEITADRGQIRGDNLFHSFSQFNINQGESANFSGPANVQNIVGRVTGNDASNIDGTLSSSIDGANLFLINPNGIMFGPNAQINITGSFHATTADYIKLGNNERFYADLNKNTSISVASPTAFGFLDNDTGDISVDGSNITTPTGSMLSLVGGDINIKNGAILSAPDGQLNLASSRSAGEFETTLDQTDASQFDALGNINVTGNSMVNASGSGGGRIVIRGGELVVDSSTVSADTEINATQTQPNIDIKMRDLLSLANFSTLTADLKAGTNGKPAGIKIASQNINVNNFSSIQSHADPGSLGDAGNIKITAKNTFIDNNSKISTSTLSTGDSGKIDIDTESLLISNRSSVKSASDFFSGTGRSGDIDIHASSITVKGVEESADYILFDFTGIDAGIDSFIAPSKGGDILIDTDILELNNNGIIRSNPAGSYSGGNITIYSDNILLHNGGLIRSATFTGSGNPGNISINNSDTFIVKGVSPNPYPLLGYTHSAVQQSGGGNSALSIKTKVLRITDGGYITSESKNLTASGNIVIEAKDLYLGGFSQKVLDKNVSDGDDYDTALNDARSQINSSAIFNTLSNKTEAAGSIFITANKATITNKAKIAAEIDTNLNTPNNSNAGNVFLSSNDLLIDDSTFIADARQTNGGNITLTANNIASITGSLFSSSVEQKSGNGGNIAIDAQNIVFLEDNKLVATAVEGNGGNISISSRYLFNINNEFKVTSELSTDGSIDISSDVEYSDDLEDLPEKSIDVSKLFKQKCIAPYDNTSSSLTISYNGASLSTLEGQIIRSYFSNYPLILPALTGIESEQYHAQTLKPPFLSKIVEVKC